jgi:pimeloyl-ACP methyl ester carboxylesterase
MQAFDYAPRKAAYRKFLDCFAKYVGLGGVNCRRVEVPYGNSALPALFVSGLASERTKAPCMVHFDGLDGTKEMIFMPGIPGDLARRGVSTLVVDNPGVGESLRLRGLTNFPEGEVPAKAAIDYLETISEVDADRIGMMANSLGGNHAPRAAALEKRIKCCVAWGVNYDWGETQRIRHANSNSSLPVPHYWEHFGWVFGKSTIEDILDVSAKLSLKGVLQHVECPILFVHGENDRQISVRQAEQCVAECTSIPRAELFVHTLADGAAEHCGVDNLPLTREVMTDWIAETLGGNTAN